MRNRGLLLLVCMAIVLVPALSVNAQTVIRGMTSDGKNKPVKVTHDGEIYVRDSSLVTDPNKILRVTEEYPAQYQSQVVPCHSDTSFGACAAVLRQVGNAWTDSPFGRRSFDITIKQPAGGALARIYLLLYGSNNNADFYPVMRAPTMLSNGILSATARWDSSAVVTEATDTVNVVGWVVTSTLVPTATTATLRFYIPPDVYGGTYLAVYCRSDSLTGGKPARITYLSANGRMF